MSAKEMGASPVGGAQATAAAGKVTAVGSGPKGTVGGARAAPLRLRAEGPDRLLPERLFGFNMVVPYDIPHEDPAMVPAVASLKPHYLRVPGGTVANYFNWRSGALEVPDVKEGASNYRRMLVDERMPLSHRLHPNGARMEDLKAIADKVGADLIIVPNLETSTIEEQVAWFEDMTSKGIVPHTVEMGNEFYHALLLDAESLRVWPDYAASMKRMKAYYDAISRFLPKGAKVSVQASASRFHNTSRPSEYTRYQRGWDWDNALAPEPWFNAVTTHMYATFSAPAGRETLKGLPGTYETIYAAMLARTEDGFTRNIRFLEEKLPGREIWVTEWGGGDHAALFDGYDIKFDGAWLNMTARGMLTLLRHPSVTITTYHALFFAGSLSSMFRRNAGAYQPITAASLLAWFHEASRGPGMRYVPVTADGVRRIEARTTNPGEGFTDVAGGLFRKGDAATLILQNAWMEPRSVSVDGLMDGRVPSRIEVMGADDLKISFQDKLPPVEEIAARAVVEVPAHTVLKAVWE
ncbi:MAG: hypothetical protein H6923_07855 [Alphaproteobacteria bacterium]|nr:hypothetical protein [Alphaproteobacteria bacterium]